jgi:anti-sigma regulatory factor (Ser/Thr protein kinase)
LIVLPARLDSCSTARLLLRAALRTAEVDSESADEALLVLSELVGNALCHGRPFTFETGDTGVGVEWTIGPSLVEVRVTDGGSGLPETQSVGLDAEGGRGLGIVEALATKWGVDRSHEGTCVWALIPRPR